MSNVLDFFKQKFVINLASRTDRLNQSIAELDKYGLRDGFLRYSGHYFTPNHVMAGRAGCFSSHRGAIQVAKDNGSENVLVLEDDFQFTINPIEVLEKCVDFLSKNEWHLFYLGQTTTSEIVERPLEVVQDGVLRLRGGLATHAIAYNKSIYDIILNEVPGPDGIINWLIQKESLDGWLMRNIQPKEEFKCYTTDPMLCVQRSSFSDIDRRFVDYSENLIKAFNNERAKA